MQKRNRDFSGSLFLFYKHYSDRPEIKTFVFSCIIQKKAVTLQPLIVA